MAVRRRAPEPLPLTVLRRGAVYVRQGEPSPGVLVVEHGMLRLSAVGPDGGELVLDLVGPGEPVGDPPGEPAACTVRAVTPVRLRPMHPSAAERAVAARARRLAGLATELASLDVASRVERRLRDLAERHGRPVPGGRVITIRLTQEELGAMVGATRETANRAVRSLVRRGAIAVIRRGRYVVRTSFRAARGGPPPATSQ